MKLIIFFLSFIALNQNIQSSVRSDLEDRDWKEVIKKSREMATTLPYANTVGMITDGRGMSSAILLDPTHVLTAAHTEFLHGPLKDVIFTNYATFEWEGGSMFADGAIMHSTELAAVVRVVRVDAHPTFAFLAGSSRVFAPIMVDAYTASMMDPDKVLASHHHSGVDLAVLTLEKPILSVQDFPQVYRGDYTTVANSYGVTFGYGPQKVNQATEAPVVVMNSDLYRRHVISNQVSFNTPNGVLFGSYQTRWGTGDESFVPTASMRKTEGLPVRGDSGGPFFLEVGDKREPQLAGITSHTMTYCSDVLGAEQMLMCKPFFSTKSTPLYPVWTPVGPHMDWIMSVTDSGIS